MSQINAEEGTISSKRGHSESAIADEIAFPNLDHAAKFCYALPLMEEVSMMGVIQDKGGQLPLHAADLQRASSRRRRHLAHSWRA